MLSGPDTTKDRVDAYSLFVTTEAHVWSGLLFEAMLTTECTGELAPPLGDLVLLLDNQNVFGRGDLALVLVKDLALLLACPQNSGGNTGSAMGTGELALTLADPQYCGAGGGVGTESWLQPPHSSPQSMTSGADPGGESGQPPKEGRRGANGKTGR